MPESTCLHWPRDLHVDDRITLVPNLYESPVTFIVRSVRHDTLALLWQPHIHVELEVDSHD